MGQIFIFLILQPKSDTTSETSSQKKRKVLKKRVKVAIPKISDFKKFLEFKLNKEKTVGLVNKPECDSEPVVDSILEKVEETVNEEPQPTKQQARKQKPNIQISKNNKLNTAEQEKLLADKTTDKEKSKTDFIFESDKLQVTGVTTGSSKDESIDTEAKVPLLHQNLIGKKIVSFLANQSS